MAMARRRTAVRVLCMVATTAFVVGVVPVLQGAASSAARAELAVAAAPVPIDPNGSGTIRLDVASAADGTAITAYQWLINVDTSGDSSQDDAHCRPTVGADGTLTYGDGFLADCQEPAVHSVDGAAPVLTQGDESDLAGSASSLTIPNGKYLISVTAAGFKIDGAHFTVNSADPALADQTIAVAMNPLPLKTLTLRVNVFNDNAATNGQWDLDSETYVPASGSTPARNDMSGFVGHLSDVLGPVTTDVYGNPLCTRYETDGAGNTTLDPDGFPIPLASDDGGASGGQLQGSASLCVTGPDGQLAIPNLGPNRYAVTVMPPDPVRGETTRWMQTTTLEGGHDWDSWVQEGSAGYDTERVIGGERTPPVDFGFVQIDEGQPDAALSRLPANGGGTLVGNVSIGRTYIPTVGSQNNGFLPGYAGTKLDGPVPDGLVALACLAACPFAGADETVYSGRAHPDGSFTVAHVPAGTYSLSLWDERQSYILTPLQVTVADGQTTDIGSIPLAGWFTELTGHIFLDTNSNGRRDPGEVGVPDFGVTVRGRSNYLYDQGQTSSVTDDDGFYDLSQIYPLTQWVVIEAFDQRYKTTGITYQADNQPSPTTLLTAQVDFDLLPVIGLSATLDWGVQPYERNENGGIVGTVSYDSTRNETNARKAGAEDYQPSVPDLPVQLWSAHRAADGSFETTPADGPAAGAVAQYGVGGCARPEDEYGTETAADAPCQPLSTYTTETWTRPTGCTTRDQDGKVVQFESMPPNGDPDYDCIEAPLASVQFGGDGSVDGNYGFADIDNGDGTTSPIPAGDYLVEVVSPPDEVMAANGRPGRKLFKFTDETSINVFSGDTYVPQDGFVQQPGDPGDPSAPVAGVGDSREDPAQAAPAIDPQCAGAQHTVDDSVTPDFQDAIGGSIFDGLDRASCDVKLVRLVNGRSIAPSFFVYTDVPVATRFFGLVINDLGVSTDKQAIVYGEAQEIAGMPINVYDEAGRLKWKVSSDYNGFYEMLLPSTDTYNCPLPAGPCPNVYRLVANDPGQPGAPNLDYNPAYRTIGTEFQGWPGVVHPVDQAVTPIGAAIEVPGAKRTQLPQCALGTGVPVLYRVDDPVITYDDGSPSYVRGGQPLHSSLTITGFNLGSHSPSGSGKVTLDGVTLPNPTWATDPTTLTSTIMVAVPTSITKGPHSLQVVTDDGRTTTSGITIHVTGSGYQPHVYTVGVGKMFSPGDDAFDPDTGEPAGGLRAIQRAIEAAHANPRNAVVVVYPNTAPVWAPFNPTQSYFESLVIHSPLRLQGVGPGGGHSNASGAAVNIPGSTIDGSSFFAAPASIVNLDGTITPTDSAYSTDWQAFTDGLAPVNHDPYPNGETVLVVSESGTQFVSTYRSSIDGFTITGGDQQGFPNNINDVGGAQNGQPRTLSETQGGGIFVHANIINLSISDNVIRSNGGSYGGGIRVGTPGLGAAANGSSSNNLNLKVLDNRIIANGGSNLAGGIAIFNGTDGYEVASNDICGNYSTEYGAGISHYGYSPNGSIHDNRVVLNSAYDEGGGIFVAGELPAVTTSLSKGAGTVSITANLVQGNLSNDDGGGIRFLMAAGPNNDPFTVANNIIANNVATHEGGGVALDDTPNVRFVNNTVVRNLTTATATTSNGQPAPAGLATGANSALLQQALNTKYGAANAPRFSNPLLLDDVFVDNRAGTWTSDGVIGIGVPGDATPVNAWDIGLLDASGTLAPHSSVLSSVQGPYTADATDTVLAGPAAIADLGFVQLWDLTVDTAALRTNPQFRQAIVVTVDAPIGQMGDYRLATVRPAVEVLVDKGAQTLSGVSPVYGLPGNALVAPGDDIDHDGRPQGTGNDIGADERPGAPPTTGPPSLPLLDSFNRSNSLNLGSSWSQASLLGLAAIGVSNQQAASLLAGQAIWNVPSSGFGPKQGAAFTFASTPSTGTCLVLKATGGSATSPANLLRVCYQTTGGGRLQVSTSTNANASRPTYTNRGAALPVSFATGNSLMVVVDATGLVSVWKTTGSTTTAIGQVTVPTSGGGSWPPGAGGGRIGMQLPLLSRVDDFKGGTL